ncbi:MAG: peptidase [Nocardioides sp.]|nr:peptidase [Nocardioides sp.]
MRPTLARTSSALAAAALVAGLLGLGATAPASAESGGGASGVPEGAPAAAHGKEPRLRTPQGWPFAQRLSRTSGTGRLHGGASYWSDFVYDDHGAALPGGFALDNLALLAPEQGVYEYPTPAARQNGADVFVAAVGLDDRASYWRVDWNTLADPRVPLAVWALDTDGKASTGVSDWPVGAGVTSDGIDRALVVSSRGVWLHDLRRGTARRLAAPTVDRRTRSFVARVPRSVLPVRGTWTVRLGAGVADATGRRLAAPDGPEGFSIPPGTSRLFNVAYRTPRQEKAVVRDSQTAGLVAAGEHVLATLPVSSQLGVDGQARFVTGNFWMEDAQADALAVGDVSRFRQRVRWRDLARERRTREPLVRGYSNRWYVSRLRLGQGVVDDEGGGTGDGRPNVLSRIQPYSVYVPRSYRPGRATPLTWTLHSLSVNHNQYGAYDPQLMRFLCEQRGTICAGTLGHGPDGWYLDEAEADFWQVWGALGRGFTLDPERTVMTGYSMGGWAGYHLGLSHPDLYAEVVVLAGPPQCGVSLDADQLVSPAFGGRCTTDGTAYDLVGNARWLPYRIGQGTLDQLVPFTSVEQHVGRFADAGLRHRFVRYPAEDHLIFAVQDRFATVLDGLGTPRRTTRPRSVDHTWRPHLDRRDLGIGATTAYWLSELRAADRGPGSLARVRATSEALPGHEHQVVTTGPTPVASPLPAVRTDTTWRTGAALPQRQRLVLDLEDVRRLTVDLRAARLRCGARIVVRSDRDSRVVLTGRGGRQVVDAGTGRTGARVRC